MLMKEILTTEKITTWITNNINNYSGYVELEKYKNLLVNKLLMGCKSIWGLECLFSDVEYVDFMIENIINENFIDLITSANFELLILDEKFSNLNTIDEINTDSTTEAGYSGYSIENQAGNFAKSKNVNKSIGTNRLQTLEYLNTTSTKWVNSIINSIRLSVVKLVY